MTTFDVVVDVAAWLVEVILATTRLAFAKPASVQRDHWKCLEKEDLRVGAWKAALRRIAILAVVVLNAADDDAFVAAAVAEERGALAPR